MDGVPSKPAAQLSWSNVGLAFSFIFFDAVVSRVLRLGVGTLLVMSALRCVIQLSLVALILQRVFDTNNPWAVAAIAFLLNFLGTAEIVINETHRRYKGMFLSVLLASLGSTIPVAILGVRYALSEEPFWRPTVFIPVVGILCGSIISNIVIALDYVLKEMNENSDRIETYLAFGASRFEACRPLATTALRLALTPTISQMSVIGLIAIPGTMTGAILGGAPVAQAARLQMVIMFLICGSSVLAACACTAACLARVVDTAVRVRSDRIDGRPHAVWRIRRGAIRWVLAALGRVREGLVGWWKRESGDPGGESESRPLLG